MGFCPYGVSRRPAAVVTTQDFNFQVPSKTLPSTMRASLLAGIFTCPTSLEDAKLADATLRYTASKPGAADPERRSWSTELARRCSLATGRSSRRHRRAPSVVRSSKHFCGFPFVLSRQLRGPELEGELVDGTGEPERQLIAVIHARPSINADVEGLVDGMRSGIVCSRVLRAISLPSTVNTPRPP